MSYQLDHDPAYRGDVKVPSPKVEVEADIGGTYPPMMNLSEKVQERLSTYIDGELEKFFQERQGLLEDWKAWQTLYWAKPETKERNFPFKRAANIVIPMAAIAVEAIHARTMNTLFSVKPFWSIRPKSKQWVESAKPTEKWLQSEVESSESLDMFEFCDETLLELYKLGTAVCKSGYERDIRKSLRNVGGRDQEFFAVRKNGATVERVPLVNYIQRFAELDPQTAGLVGEKHSDLSWSQMKKYAASGRMRADAVEKIKSHWRDVRQSEIEGDGEDYKRKVDELANTEPAWFSTFSFYELWISFDVDGDGWDEEIVVDYHKESKTFLSARYNWYDDLHRPYRICTYFNVEGIWPGIGVCKQVEQFQAEVTAIHRQRLDNATLANMAQIVLRKNSGYGPGEPIFPGKMWFLDSIDDIKEFKLSDNYPSTYSNEQSVVTYAEKRTGVNDIILGSPTDGTPATATSDISRLSESNKRFDLVLKKIKRWLSLIGVDVITNYQIFGDQQVHWLVLGEEGVYVEAVLRMPSVLVRRGAIVELTVSDTITNRETERAQWLQLFQVFTGFFKEVLPVAQMFGPEALAQIVMKMVTGTDELTRRVFETYNVTDVDKFTLMPKEPPNGAGNVLPAGTPRLGLPPGVSG